MVTIANKYAPRHISTDALGGMLRLNSANAMAGHRFTVPYQSTPDVLWMRLGNEGLDSTHTLTVRLGIGSGSGSYQPDLTAASIVITPSAIMGSGTAAQWVKIDLGAMRIRRRKGTVMHLTLTPLAGTWDDQHQLAVYTVRARFPIQFTTDYNPNSGIATRDDKNAAMYTADTTNTATPYAVQRDNNASGHPLFLIQCSDAPSFGNPYDQHTEVTIYGTGSFAQIVKQPAGVLTRFVAMFLRGAGPDSVLGPPDGPCLLTIQERTLPTFPWVTIYGPQTLIPITARMFQGRSHHYGHWLTQPLRLLGNSCEYKFLITAPGCDLSDVNDGYLASYDTSSLPANIVATYGGTNSYCELNGQGLGHADAPYLLSDQATTPIATVDEILAPLAGAWPLYKASGAAVDIAVCTRNVGLDTATGSELFVRLIDADSGAVLHAEQLFTIGSTNQNNEGTITCSTTMPAADLHMTVQVGHVSSGTYVVDDHAPVEIRLIP
jgi:hypothetical protein